MWECILGGGVSFRVIIWVEVCGPSAENVPASHLFPEYWIFSQPDPRPVYSC